jgi:hypothetical protein
MKKWILGLMLLAVAVSANAQFEAGTKYLGASLTNLGLSYSTHEKFRLGIGSSVGYFVADQFMVKADISYNHTNHIDDVSAGLSGRYYFSENGIFMGAGADYVHYTKSNNDVQIPVEVGYCFYLNHYVSVEPAVYYRMSLDDFSKKSTVGLKVGIGFYF